MVHPKFIIPNTILSLILHKHLMGVVIRGNGASVARIVPYAALHYMAYEEYRRWIILGFPGTGRGPVLDLMAGSFAGGTAVLFTYPLDLVRTKLAYQASNEMAMSLPLSENCLSLSLSHSHTHTHTQSLDTNPLTCFHDANSRSPLKYDNSIPCYVSKVEG